MLFIAHLFPQFSISGRNDGVFQSANASFRPGSGSRQSCPGMSDQFGQEFCFLRGKVVFGILPTDVIV